LFKLKKRLQNPTLVDHQFSLSLTCKNDLPKRSSDCQAGLYDERPIEFLWQQPLQTKFS